VDGEGGDVLPLGPHIVRNLSDKLYEKRKLGALEIETLVKGLSPKDDRPQIARIVEYLTDNFINSPNANHRKGGLLAMAAIAIGLGGEIYVLITEIVMPVLKCFSDQDSRVRYYACESMYNVAKVSRGQILVFFNDIFDGMCKLCADPDVHVKNGTKLLDRLVKDVVAEIENFDTEKFIPILQDRIGMTNAFVRQFLLGWIAVLNSVPNIDLVNYLQYFLDGLFNMLSDKKNDLQKEAEVIIAEFLREIKGGKVAELDYAALVTILLPHCTSSDDLTRLISVTWINELIILGREKMLPFAPKILGAILPGFSNDVLAVKEQIVETNASLASLIHDTSEEFDIGSMLHVITVQFQNEYVATRLAALRWLLSFHEKSSSLLDPFVQELLPSLLRNLSDPSDEVVRQNLGVMATISQNEALFDILMTSLVKEFRTDRQLLEMRGSLIVRQLSVHLPAEKILRSLASIVEKEEEYEFASLMVQTLNLILLTSREMFDLRNSLQNLDKEKSDRELFAGLYRSWCHNPTATLSLCLLSCMHKHAYHVVKQFSQMEITVNFLVELDKLVQLLESPIFSSLRLQLLEPQRYPYLYKCLFGLLMLLPQSGAFETLRTRLTTAASFAAIPLDVDPGEQPVSQQLLEHFIDLQKRRQEASRQKQGGGKAGVSKPEKKAARRT